MVTLGNMSLLITPPQDDSSVWQAVCETHGVLVRAVRSRHALWIARLHEFHCEQECTVWVGGIRCMFCYGVVEVDHWMADVQICCDMCMQQVLTDHKAAMVPLALGEIPRLAHV